MIFLFPIFVFFLKLIEQKKNLFYYFKKAFYNLIRGEIFYEEYYLSNSGFLSFELTYQFFSGNFKFLKLYVFKSIICSFFSDFHDDLK